MVDDINNNNNNSKNNNITSRLTKGILILLILFFICYNINNDINNESKDEWELLGVNKGVITYKKKIKNSNLLAFRGVTEIPYHISVSMGPFIDLSLAYEWIDMLEDVKVYPLKKSIDKLLPQSQPLLNTKTNSNSNSNNSNNSNNNKSITINNNNNNNNNNNSINKIFNNFSLKIQSIGNLKIIKSIKQFVDKVSGGVNSRLKILKIDMNKNVRNKNNDKNDNNKNNNNNNNNDKNNKNSKSNNPIDNSKNIHGSDDDITKPKMIDIIYEKFSLPWPIASREILLKRQWFFNYRSRSVSILYQSVDDSRVPIKKNTVRAESNHTFWKFQDSRYISKSLRSIINTNNAKIDSNSCKSPSSICTVIEIECLVDSKGSVPKWFINIMQRKWPSKALGAFYNLVKTNKAKPYDAVKYW